MLKKKKSVVEFSNESSLQKNSRGQNCFLERLSATILADIKLADVLLACVYMDNHSACAGKLAPPTHRVQTASQTALEIGGRCWKRLFLDDIVSYSHGAHFQSLRINRGQETDEVIECRFLFLQKFRSGWASSQLSPSRDNGVARNLRDVRV